MDFLKRFFSVSHMMKDLDVKGDIPASGTIYKNLANIAIPALIEMVFISIIGSVDMVMLRGLPDPAAAIASVGLAGQPRMLTLAMFFALNVGVTAIVARRKGEERKEDANRALRNAILIVVLLSAVMVTVTLFWSRSLLLLAGAKADTIEMSNQYFRIMTYFLPVSTLTMCINSAQRGVGNTRTTMYVNLTSNIVNVILDIFFIYGYQAADGRWIIPAMGVAGDAWATGIGICVGFVLCLISITGRRSSGGFLRLSLKDSWWFHRETVGSILRIGGNAMVEQCAMRLGFFTYAAIIAGIGTQAVAAHNVGLQFLNLSYTVGDGLAVAATSLVGQMLGKERPDLASIYGRSAQRVAFCAGIVLASLIMLFRAPLVGIFLDASVETNTIPIKMALEVMMILGLFQPIQMSNVVIAGCLWGAGDNLHVALTTLICIVILRPTLSMVAVNFLGIGLVGAWSASLVDMGVRLTLNYRRFLGGKWQLMKV